MSYDLVTKKARVGPPNLDYTDGPLLLLRVRPGMTIEGADEGGYFITNDPVLEGQLVEVFEGGLELATGLEVRQPGTPLERGQALLAAATQTG